MKKSIHNELVLTSCQANCGKSNLRGAQKLYSEIADGTNILTKTRLSDKATLIYKPSTNEFLAVSSDGYIKTYFKPKDGIKYWESLN